MSTPRSARSTSCSRPGRTSSACRCSTPTPARNWRRSKRRSKSRSWPTYISSTNCALTAIAAGFDKIRINPGNIGEDWKVREVTKAAKDKGIPIRIGVNSGSLPKDLLEQYGHDDPRAFVEAALREAAVLEEMDFHDIVISVKSTNTNTAFWAYHLLGQRVRLSAPRGYHRGRDARNRDDQIVGRDRRHSPDRNRRHDPGLPLGRSDSRDQSRPSRSSSRVRSARRGSRSSPARPADGVRSI